MQFSAPIYVLKRRAKLLARETGIALHIALDKVAIEEGFKGWSHLASSEPRYSPARKVLSRLAPGDLVLIGARPGQRKTLLGLELALSAPELARRGHFFTLDYHKRDVESRLNNIGADPTGTDMVVDTSDDVSADHIIRRLDADKAPALVVVDYLQLLDQKRTNPSLDDQVKSLGRYVCESGAICAIISQIDRSFDLQGRSMPGVTDIRLPNPLDLSVFHKLVFLHEGKIQMDLVPA